MYHILFRSRNAIGHVTIIPAVGGFLIVAHWPQPCTSHGFPDTKPQLFQGHDLDRWESHDVIGHVTVRFAVGSFL